MSERRSMRGSRFSQWIGAQFYLEADGSVTVQAALREEHGGPPGHIHGGVLASLLDEAMGASAWQAGHKSVAANLTVNFKLPVPVGSNVSVSAQVERIEGRKAFTRATLALPDGTAAVEATAIFIAIPNLPDDGGFALGELMR